MRTESLEARLQRGACNLLVDCAGLGNDDSILIVHEKPELGWWDAEVVESVAQQASALGISVELLETDSPTNQRDENIQQAMLRYNCTLFFARVGDQDRFAEPTAGKKIVMCYTRDNDMLASEFGCAPYQAMKQFKLVLDSVITASSKIEITCPQGSHLIGLMEPVAAVEAADVSILRFPMGIVSPIPAERFSGRVALTGYLTPTGSAVYEPASLKLDSRTMAIIDNGKITGFDGPDDQVKLIEAHYQRVASQFNLEPYVVHSWHAGIHPGLVFSCSEDDNPDLWGNTVFNHPRYLHFHTCGTHAPGEISWLLQDHTVTLDGIELWRNGRLQPENFELSRQCLRNFPDVGALFEIPTTTVAEVVASALV
jgi:hypothetical protein